jgi:hypothetical protein
LTYSRVDASMWACAKEMASREYGIRIESDHGEASKRGFRLKWTYDASEETLQIQCTRKPFFVSCDKVNNRIKGAAEKCGLSAA